MTKASFQSALEEIFDIPKGSLQSTDSRDTVEGWTSIADVQVLTTISTEFGLEPDADLLQAETVGDLLQALQEKGAFRN
jgi:acyl carrier protein